MLIAEVTYPLKPVYGTCQVKIYSIISFGVSLR
jgi:hypothetical protein